MHRNTISMLMRPLGKISNGGVRPIYGGGGVRLATYDDGRRKAAPYREYFPRVGGLWPETSWRLLWAWAFRYPPLSWLQATRGGRYPPGTYNENPDWDMGPHLPGMQRISRGRFCYTRWCVPVDRDTTREFFLHAFRPQGKADRLLEACRYPVAYRLIYYRNLAMQDGVNLAHVRFDALERFSDFDMETLAWRRLAILTARHGGRHDRIPPAELHRLNGITGVAEPVARTSRSDT
jgi:hypothetical protein